MSGSATFATARFRFATAATRMSATRTSGAREGALPVSTGGALVSVMRTASVRVRHLRARRGGSEQRGHEDAEGQGAPVRQAEVQVPEEQHQQPGRREGRN